MQRRRSVAIASLGLALASASAATAWAPTALDQRTLGTFRGGGGGGGGLPPQQRQRPSPTHVRKASRLHDSTYEETNDSDIQKTQRGMSLALAATYFTVMGAKCALPTVLPLLLDPTTGLVFADHWQQTPQELMARQLTLATLAVALGKVLLGPVIDRFGGIRSLQVALTALGGLLAAIALGSSFLGFAVAWIFVDFIFSSCWAGCINAIHQAFPPEQWATRIGTLAAAARLGNAVAFASFAAVLSFFTRRVRQTWRPVFAISALVQVLPVLLLRHYGGQISQQQRRRRRSVTTSSAQIDRPSLGQSLGTLRTEATTAEFWLHLISRSVLMVFASFLLFVPTLMSQVYGASAALGAQTGSIYALGCLLAVTLVSPFYAKFGVAGKVGMLAGALSMAVVASLAQLAHVSGVIRLSAASSAALLFLWGLSFAIPFYSKYYSGLSIWSSVLTRNGPGREVLSHCPYSFLAQFLLLSMRYPVEA